MKLSATERFDAKFTPEPNTGCWLWHGYQNGTGYGGFWTGVKYDYAHRYSYERAKGKIEEGLEIDHLCRTRCCVNPDHLEAVTRQVNSLRSSNPLANNARKNSCKRGHEFTEENTYRWSGRHGRACRACHRERQLMRKN